MNKTNDEIIKVIQHTLKVEALSYGCTLLKEQHCLKSFHIREQIGINHYTKGSVTFSTNKNNRIKLSDSDAIILPVGVLSRFTNHDPGKTTSHWHSIHYSIMDTINPLQLLEIPLLVGDKQSKIVARINKQLFQIEKLKNTNFLEFIVKQHALAIQLFEVILSVSKLKPDAHIFFSKTKRIQPALQYIKGNLLQNITIKKLASLITVSEPRLYELFRDSIGTSPNKYIQQQRMRKAQELLMNSDIRIHEVAEQSGYNDQFHFSRLFKKNFNICPEAFRKQISAG